MTTELDQWERELEPQISRVQLIGELNLSREDTEKLGRLIAELVHSYGPQSALWPLRHRYPCCLVAYLVFQGVYGYDEGDYWSGVCQTIGLPNSPNYTQKLGQAFEAALEHLGLSHNFEGHRYVGAILGHGGIPANSLHDFFEHVLQPSIERPEFAGLPAREFIAQWLTRSYWYHADKPVWRFLQNGGQVAEDFVERCRQMAWAYQETGDVPLAEEVGLPEAVVARYEEWIEDPTRAELRRQPGPRWVCPSIIFNPWGQGVVASLPEQPPALLSGQREAWWEVCMDDHVERVRVRIQRTGVIRSEPPMPLRRPAREYRIRLVIDDVDQGPSPWIYAGVDDTYPLLVFDARTGKLLPRPRVLPGRSLWLLCPPDVQLGAEPAQQDFIRERLPPPPGDWYTWSAYQVDLSGLSALVLHTPQGDRRIGVREELQQPALVGGEVLDLGDESFQLYIGHPPRLHIPWRRTDSKGHLSHWQLHLRSEEGANPIRDLKASLDKFAGVLHWKADAMELPLDHPDLLGAIPIGRYHLRVRDPLGYRADLSFRIVPKLSVTGHEPLYLPDPQQGAFPVQLLIETDAQSRLELLRDDATIRLQCISTGARGHCYQVDVAPEQTDVPLRLIHNQGGSVTFSIPVRRLRWQLVLHPTENRPTAWQSRAILISLTELDKSESPYLLVEAPGSDWAGASVQLRFLDAEGTLQEDVPSRLSRCYRFDLRRVRDSLRQSTSPVICAELIAQGLPDHNTIRLPVLIIRREIYIEQVTIVPRWDRDQISLDLTWQPDLRLSGRYVRFWSQTRPWAEPVEFSLPDTARGRVILSAQTDMLPIGEYLIEFIVRDPWLPSMVERPSPQAPNVVTVKLGDLAQRISQLDKAIAEEGERFTTICERVFLWRALGEQQRAKQDFQWCCGHLEEATEEQMLALARAFEGDLDARIILRRVFRPERVRQKLDAYKKGELSEAELRSYLAQLPPIPELSSATQKVLLNAPDENIQFQAAWELIWDKQLPDVRAVLMWTRQETSLDLNNLTMLQVAVAIVLIEEGELTDIQTILRWAEERLQSDFNGPGTIAVTEALQLLQPDRSLEDMIGTWNDLGMLPRPDDIKLILNLIQVVAVRELIKRDESVGIQIVTDWIERGLLSEPDASELCPQLVLPGCWVRCQAGWGQIERIKASNGQKVLCMHQDEILQRGYNLDIRLRATEEGGEAVTLDIPRHEIYFMRAAELYVCTKCRQFATSDVNLILRQHDRRAHGGVEASYERLQGNCLPQRSQLDFSARRPSNVWQ